MLKTKHEQQKLFHTRNSKRSRKLQAQSVVNSLLIKIEKQFMIKIQQQHDWIILKSWIQEYQPLVLIQTLLCILFNSFPGCKFKIWKFLPFFISSMISDHWHLRWANQSFWQFKGCIIPLENLEFWAENMHLTHAGMRHNVNNEKRTNPSTNSLNDLKKLESNYWTTQKIPIFFIFKNVLLLKFYCANQHLFQKGHQHAGVCVCERMQSSSFGPQNSHSFIINIILFWSQQ